MHRMKAATAALALLLCQCAGPTRISPQEFKREYASIPLPATMINIEYLGQKDGAAYINHQTMSLLTGNFKDRILYTPLEDFDAAFRRSLPLGRRTSLDLMREEQAKAKPHRGKIGPNNIDAILNGSSRGSQGARGGRDFED